MTTFTKTIEAIATTTLEDLSNVIKRVDWVLVGEREGFSFSVPQTTLIANPDPSAFIPLLEVTQANVERWIDENASDLTGLKAHIEGGLDRMIADAAPTPQPLPWIA